MNRFSGNHLLRNRMLVQLSLDGLRSERTTEVDANRLVSSVMAAARASDVSAAKSKESPRRIGEILDELIACYRQRYPVLNIEIVKTGRLEA